MLSIRSRSILSFSKAVFATLFVAGFCGADPLNHQLDMTEQSWNEDEGIVFDTEFIGSEPNAWGNVRLSDFYMLTDSPTAYTDIYLPSSQIVESTGVVKIEIDVRYLSSANHNYIGFGNDDSLDNAIWFGFNNQTFMAGTGSDLNISSSGGSPSADFIEFSRDVTYTNDTRIGVRIGYDADNQQLRNFQVDHDNDGSYDDELLDGPIDVSAAGLVPEDWYFLSYFGGTGSRIDDASLLQFDPYGDYTRDLDFDGEDANAICKAIIAGDLALDYDQSGAIDADDLAIFLRDNGSLVSDFDHSGFVDFSDFLILSRNFGTEGTYTDGDASCNDFVGFEDFLVLSRQFNRMGRRAEAVPEPSSLAIIVSAIACLALFRTKGTRGVTRRKEA